jgi:hypothetical protein
MGAHSGYSTQLNQSTYEQMITGAGTFPIEAYWNNKVLEEQVGKFDKYQKIIDDAFEENQKKERQEAHESTASDADGSWVDYLDWFGQL